MLRVYLWRYEIIVQYELKSYFLFIKHFAALEKVKGEVYKMTTLE